MQKQSVHRRWHRIEIAPSNVIIASDLPKDNGKDKNNNQPQHEEYQNRAYCDFDAFQQDNYLWNLAQQLDKSRNFYNLCKPEYSQNG
mmetsp:Transcript_35383/g.65996  ORF Transcript_35383/g.65996 Transcript_35383/m.65996 type:complete len:87 (-) Transcript_35383:192-452(-)